jgi:hypothetical protein
VEIAHTPEARPEAIRAPGGPAIAMPIVPAASALHRPGQAGVTGRPGRPGGARPNTKYSVVYNRIGISPACGAP